VAKPILFFGKSDDWFELSNFYPQGIEEGGVSWPTVEHYFQAQKFTGDEHAEYRERIRTAGSPQHAKTLGRTTKLAIRTDWDAIRDSVMLSALRRKFAHPKLRTILLSTKKRHLIENSPFDSYWGIGRRGRGKNRLGTLLMQVRIELTEGA
jgi:ribA/ribD-fused uncharacterized protein